MQAVRLAAGLSQRQLAKLLKVSAPYISMMECGIRTPSADVAYGWRRILPELQARAQRRIGKAQNILSQVNSKYHHVQARNQKEAQG